MFVDWLETEKERGRGKGETEREREREREASISGLSYAPWHILNLQTFGTQDDAPTNGATWPGRLLKNLFV